MHLKSYKGVLSTDSAHRKAHKFYISLTSYITCHCGLVQFIYVVNGARLHSSLKAKDFVQWPTCIYVFRCKILWSFVDAYCFICFPA